MSAVTSPERPLSLLTRNFLALGAGEVISRAIGFAATVYLARVLGVASYGVVGFALAVILYFWAVADGGVELLGPRLVAAERAASDEVVSAVLTLRLLVAATVSPVLGLLGVLVLPQPEGAVLAVYGLTLFAVAASPRWVHVGLEAAAPAGGARVGVECVRLTLVVALVRGPGDVALVPLAHFVAESAGTLFLLVWLRRAGWSLRLRLRVARAWDLWRRARPLMTTTLLGLLVYNADLILLRLFRSRHEVGLYFAAFAVVTLLGNIGNALRLSLIPALERLADDPSARGALLHASIARVLALGLPVAAGGVLLAEGLLRAVFGEAYGPAAGAMRILLATIPALLVRSALEGVLIARERQDRVLRETAWGTLANVGLNLVAIPLLGIVGAALTTLASEILRAGLTVAYARRQGICLPGGSRVWRSAAATAVMALTLIVAGVPSVWAAVALGALAYVGTLTLLGGLRFGRGAVPVLRV